MTDQYDVVVAGGGSNGLTVAAYLARAGLSVCVVEAADYVGGGVITQEVNNPGFRHDLASTGHMFIQPNPLLLNDELDLVSKYGLKYLYPKVMASIIFPDDKVMRFYQDLDKTCESIAQFSEKDAQAYRRFHAWAIASLDMFTAGMFSPPPPFGSFVAMMDQNPTGQELLRTLMVSGLDIVNDWFESDAVKIACTRFIAEGMVDPQVKGTGLNFVLFVGLIHKYGWGLPQGGSGSLSEALVRSIEADGGTILTSSRVKRFIVSGGECTGVELESGVQIQGKKAVISTMNIQQMPAMIGSENLPAGFTHRVERMTHSNFSALHQVLDLEELPNYRAGLTDDEAAYVQFVPDNFEEAMQVFDDYKFGRTHVNAPLAICWSQVDPTRAPAGKHTLYLYHFEPYGLREGSAAWDAKKQEVADGVVEFFQSRTTNMGKDTILGRWAASPLDYERMDNAFVQGDWGHIGMDLYQNMGNRPLPEIGQYRMPIKRLYLAGCSTAPGGGASCGSRAAVPIIMQDLGMDFDELISGT